MSALNRSPYYLTDGQFFMNGYDWTKPFPGSALSSYDVNLTISQEMHISEDIVEDATTVLSSLTFGTPESIMLDQAQLKPMGQS
ncbi:hypothetical protein BKA61DRAFT_679723 [Leptodontidium sp. MPI-SDFR-AT-0119]|nr:hypothetical protein BKA61DRAFT_679723 [Leptodontidium sp. MPI-SDFR-AT-0119]